MWVSEEKRNKDLTESEVRYRRLFEAAKDGILIINAKSGEINDINPYLLDLLGYSKEELLGKQLWQLGVFKDKLRSQDSFRELQKSGYVHYEDLPLETKDGHSIAVEFISNVYVANSEMVIQCNIRYIAERKIAEEEALRQSEQRYQDLYDNAPIACFSIDSGGYVVQANKAACSLLGYSFDELIGKQRASIYAEECHTKATMIFKRFMQGKPINDEEMIYQTKDGEKVYGLLSVSPITDASGNIIASRSVVKDITQRKKAEADLVKSYATLKKTLNDAINTMAKIVEMRDPYTAGHQQRVAKLAITIAKELKFNDLQIERLWMAAVVHDIGKIYVPSDILNKPGKMSELEFQIIKTHPQGGYDIVKGMEFPHVVAQSILQHHERLNGSGYPSGLKDKDITNEAKIIAVADVVEAMASHRPYRPALGIDKALEEILRNKGILYDTEIVEACVRLFEEKKFEFE